MWSSIFCRNDDNVEKTATVGKKEQGRGKEKLVFFNQIVTKRHQKERQKFHLTPRVIFKSLRSRKRWPFPRDQEEVKTHCREHNSRVDILAASSFRSYFGVKPVDAAAVFELENFMNVSLNLASIACMRMMFSATCREMFTNSDDICVGHTNNNKPSGDPFSNIGGRG